MKFEQNPNISWRTRVIDSVAAVAAGAVITMGAAMADRAGAQLIPMPEAAATFVDETNCNVQESMHSVLGLGSGVTSCDVREQLGLTN